MSGTTFIEATSTDPFVRDLYRRAVRLLNDPTLDRRQREFHMRKLQSILLEHQKKEAAKAARLLAKKVTRDKDAGARRSRNVAHPSQVASRRKELGSGMKVEEGATKPNLVSEEGQPVGSTGSAANDNRMGPSSRPVLKLKTA